MTDILHITDRERTQAAVILALESARDEMAKRIEALTAELAEARLQFIAAFGQEQERGWQPIETAPKDFVTVFDGWNGERVPNVSWGHPTYSPKETFDWCVEEYEQHFGWVNAAVKGLTHWMPLPPPPADKPIWDQLAEIGASDPQAWDKP